MRFGVTMLVVAALAACSRDSIPPTAPTPSAPAPAPPAPPPPPPSPSTGSALLWVMVIDGSGVCIEGGTVQIMRAEVAVDPIAQTTPCDAWGYGDVGVLFRDLTPGVELTLRGAAPGYTTREMRFLPFPMPGSYTAVFITLSKAQ